VVAEVGRPGVMLGNYATKDAEQKTLFKTLAVIRFTLLFH